MKHVYDVEYDVYHRDRSSRQGYWDYSCSLSITANGDIGRAMRKAVRVVLSRRTKPERDRKTGRVFRYVPMRVRVTSIAQAREISE